MREKHSAKKIGRGPMGRGGLKPGCAASAAVIHSLAALGTES